MKDSVRLRWFWHCAAPLASGEAPLPATPRHAVTSIQALDSMHATNARLGEHASVTTQFMLPSSSVLFLPVVGTKVTRRKEMADQRCTNVAGGAVSNQDLPGPT